MSILYFPECGTNSIMLHPGKQALLFDLAKYECYSSAKHFTSMAFKATSLSYLYIYIKCNVKQYKEVRVMGSSKIQILIGGGIFVHKTTGIITWQIIVFVTILGFVDLLQQCNASKNRYIELVIEPSKSAFSNVLY